MNKVRVVAGYVPLEVKHMNKAQYADLGEQLALACKDAGVPIDIYKHPYEECWLAKENPPMVGANPRATDRFDTDEQHAKSNVVCCQFVEWAWQTYKEKPKTDVIVALVYSVMRQGDFTGKRVQPHHISAFLHRVQNYDFTDVPFPGITGVVDQVPVDDVCWRFCGSTHIWPTKWLKPIRKSFKGNVRRFIERYHKTPLDLQIWPLVEQQSDHFRWYKAEYDYTQFTNFPGAK